MLTKIIFPVLGNSIENKRFSKEGLNPGVGGTQFATIILAISLAKERKDYEVYLWTEVEVKIVDSPKNLKQILIKDAPFPNSELFNSSITIFICTDGTIKDHINSPELIKCKIINWMHHPFVISSYFKNLKFSAHVSVGTYQYYSNNLWYKPHLNIPNLFNFKSFNSTPLKTYSSDQTLRIVFLGALVLGKGFHFVAKEWPKLKKKFPKIQLDVIGSTETYSGDKPENKRIPTTNEYAKNILKYISEDDLKNKRVIFHGNLGEEKYKIIGSAHLAIINPTGRTETFSYSSLECLMCATPVITSYDYGMSDFMRNFPEMVLNKPTDMTLKIFSTINNPKLFENLQKKSVLVAKSFSHRKSKILLRWQNLIDDLSSNKVIKNNPPAQSFKGSYFFLIIRIFIRCLFIFTKLLYLKLKS